MTAPAATITGVAAVAPNGVGTDAYWKATRQAECGIGPITRYDADRYPVSLAGEIHDFDERDHLTKRMLPQTDRVTRLALAASDWVLDDAGIDPADLEDFAAGVMTASSAGGHEFGQKELQKLWSEGPDHVSAYQSFAWFYAVNTGQISIRHGLRGASGVVVSEAAGGLDTLAQARRQLRDGMEVMVTGSIDASLCPWGLVAQLPNGRLSRGVDPASAYTPFAEGADGYVPGEGGALLIMEPADRAQERGAEPYGTLDGYAATFDPAPGSGRPPGLQRAIEGALADAGIDPADIDVVFADGAGVADLDRQEADALTAVFGPAGVPVTVPKTMTGRMHSGSPALDVVTALLALRDGCVPPTVGTTAADPALDLDLVTEARPARLARALVIARGYGGFNAAVVITAP